MLSDLRKQKLTLWFDLQDGNKDGFLEESDYVGAAQKLNALRGLAPGSAEAEATRATCMAYWHTLQGMAGAGQPERVARAEFLSGHGAIYSNPETYEAVINGHVVAMFDMLDADHDGEITGAEMDIIYQLYGVDGGAELFREFDTNDDGRLSREEFAQVVREFHGDDPQAVGNRLFGEPAQA